MSTGLGSDRESGWTVFAIYLFLILGAVNIIHGIAILANADWVVFTASGAWLLDFTAWGWLNLVLGVLQLFIGLGLTNRREWARVTGITLAMLGAVIAVFAIPIYAVWGILAFTLSLLVLYGLSAHPFVE